MLTRQLSAGPSITSLTATFIAGLEVWFTPLSLCHTNFTSLFCDCAPVLLVHHLYRMTLLSCVLVCTYIWIIVYDLC